MASIPSSGRSSYRKDGFCMRPDSLYLADILAAADDVRILVSEQTFESFARAMPIRRAALQAILEIGEAAANVSADVQS